MIRAPDVDERVGPGGFLEVIGQVRAKIGPATVALSDRAVLIVAEPGRAEQRQFDRLPIIEQLALGRFQLAVVNQIMRAQPRFGFGGFAGGLQFGLGTEQIMVDAEQGEVGLDHHQHRRNRAGAEQREPIGFGGSGIGIAKFGRQVIGHRDQVIAGIEPLGHLAHGFAERLAVPQMDRAGEHIDLPAGVVDIVFADHCVPGKFEQAGQGIAYHRTAAMAHMHRPGRVGRDIFDVDGAAPAQR